MTKKRILWAVILTACLLFAIYSVCLLLPAGHTQNDSSPSSLTVGFLGYQEYLAFFQETSAYPDSSTIDAHLHECKSNPDALVVPCYDGAPVPLRHQEGYDGICILESELYNYLWTWFYTYIDGQDVRICISKLSAEDAALAKQKSCAKFIAAIAPSAPNLHNYFLNTNYLGVYEDEAIINGSTTSVFVQQTKQVAQTGKGQDYVYFVTDGYLVCVVAPTNTLTKDWLGSFSLSACAEDVIHSNNNYELLYHDGQYTLVLADKPPTSTAGTNPSVFADVPEMLQAIKTGKISVKYLPRSASNKINLFDLDNPVDVVFPDNVTLKGVSWGDTKYRFLLESYMFENCSIDWYTQDELLNALQQYSDDLNVEEGIHSRKKIADRHATEIICSDSTGTYRQLQYQIPGENRTLFVCETYRYQKINDELFPHPVLDSTPIEVQIFCKGDDECFRAIMTNLLGRPSEEWLSAFGLVPLEN